MSVQGLIGTKIGTTQMFRDSGDAVCVTAIKAGPCTVTQIKTHNRDGYTSIQLGFDEVSQLNSPQRGHLRSADRLFRILREFEAENIEEIKVGQEIDVSMFEPGEKINATALFKGRGFAGGVKRYNFRGGPKTHGQSDRHRAPGSIGAGSTPGRVIKGLRMAGHMGNVRVTAPNLEIVSIDEDRDILFVKGAIPGSRNSLVLLRKSFKQRSLIK